MKEKTKTPSLLALFVVAVWLLLAAISYLSGYSIRDVKSLNWDIALMLTPWGFIHNFLLVDHHYLRPYYDSAAERGSLAHDPLLAAAVGATLILSIAGVFYFRRTHAKRPSNV